MRGSLAAVRQLARVCSCLRKLPAGIGASTTSISLKTSIEAYLYILFSSFSVKPVMRLKIIVSCAIPGIISPPMH